MGNLLLLKEQDRTQWDQPMIARGMLHLARSATGDEIFEYHLQAGVAACHCTAKDYESTDWRQILSLYDRLVEKDDSPVIALNRAVVIGNVHGPRAGLDAVDAIPGREKLDSYYLFYAVLGEFEAQLNDPLAAAGYFRKSVQLAQTASEQQFLTKRFQACEQQIDVLSEADRLDALPPEVPPAFILATSQPTSLTRADHSAERHA
jgi:RNA polymerase sigma-70 factor (ECF subfamily)